MNPLTQAHVTGIFLNILDKERYLNPNLTRFQLRNRAMRLTMSRLALTSDPCLYHVGRGLKSRLPNNAALGSLLHRLRSITLCT